MALFAILVDQPNDDLGAIIQRIYPKDSYRLSGNQWLVSADAVARSIADELDIRDGKFGRGVVVRVEGDMSGWHAKSLWDWKRQQETVD